MFQSARSCAVIASWPAPNSQPAGLLWRRPERSERMAQQRLRIVRRRAGRRRSRATDVILSGVKIRCRRNSHERHAGHALDDRCGDHVVGVAVLPLGAGLEVERLARPSLHDLARRRRPLHVHEHVVLRPVVLVARGHRQQLPDADVRGARQLREPLRDLVVERELAVLLKQQDRRGGELLADRADRVAHVGPRRRIGLDPRRCHRRARRRSAPPRTTAIEALGASGGVERRLHASVDRGAFGGGERLRERSARRNDQARS